MEILPPSHGYAWQIPPNRVVSVLADSLEEARLALKIAVERAARHMPDQVVDLAAQATPETCSTCGSAVYGEQCTGCDQPWFMCDCGGD